jgi:hypothetical protein
MDNVKNCDSSEEDLHKLLQTPQAQLAQYLS